LGGAVGGPWRKPPEQRGRRRDWTRGTNHGTAPNESRTSAVGKNGTWRVRPRSGAAWEEIAVDGGGCARRARVKGMICSKGGRRRRRGKLCREAERGVFQDEKPNGKEAEKMLKWKRVVRSILQTIDCGVPRGDARVRRRPSDRVNPWRDGGARKASVKKRKTPAKPAR